MASLHAIESRRRAAVGSAAPDTALLERYHELRDPADRELLVLRYLPLARYVARRFAGRLEPYDDLLQVASLELLRALDRYDPGRESTFPSYAIPTMIGAIKRHLRDRTWVVHVPRNLQDRALGVRATTAAMSARLGRRPTPRELAERLSLSEEEIVEALAAMAAQRPESLEGGDDEAGAIGERVGYHEDGYDRAEQRLVLDGLLRHVTRCEREVLRLRYEEELTQREIGARTGISQMQVSRMLRRSLLALSEHADAA